MPEPVVAPPAVGLDDVTNGYVPWSTSSSVPCDPSEQDPLAGVERLAEQQPGVDDPVLEGRGVGSAYSSTTSSTSIALRL